MSDIHPTVDRPLLGNPIHGRCASFVHHSGWRKISLVAALLWAGLPGVGALAATAPSHPPVEEGRAWITIQDDSGLSELASQRGQVTSPRAVLRKVLVLDFDPAQVAAAELLYEMKIDPYHPTTKGHHSAPEKGIGWADMRILVNGAVAVEKPGIELATKGWHTVKIDPALLVEGPNRVDFTWAPLPEGNPDDLRYGYFYMGLDTSRDYDRSLSSNDHGETFTAETLNPGREDGPTGEYMVRLRVGIPLDVE